MKDFWLKAKVEGISLLRATVFIISLFIVWGVFLFELLLFLLSFFNYEMGFSYQVSDWFLAIQKRLFDEQLKLTLFNNPYDPNYKENDNFEP